MYLNVLEFWDNNESALAGSISHQRGHVTSRQMAADIGSEKLIFN